MTVEPKCISGRAQQKFGNAFLSCYNQEVVYYFHRVYAPRIRFQLPLSFQLFAYSGSFVPPKVRVEQDIILLFRFQNKIWTYWAFSRVKLLGALL